MVQCYIKGEYKKIPYKTILYIIAGILYVVLPADVIPDIIPGLGIADDISLVRLILSYIADDIENFKKWKKESKNDK